MSDEKFERIINLLEDIKKWTKFQGWNNVKNVLSDVLDDDLSKLIYQFSNGQSSRNIAKRLPISHKTVTNYWKKWARIGIVEAFKVKGGGTRYQRIFLLNDFGIEMPQNVTGTQEENK